MVCSLAAPWAKPRPYSPLIAATVQLVTQLPVHLVSSLILPRSGLREMVSLHETVLLVLPESRYWGLRTLSILSMQEASLHWFSWSSVPTQTLIIRLVFLWWLWKTSFTLQLEKKKKLPFPSPYHITPLLFNPYRTHISHTSRSQVPRTDTWELRLLTQRAETWEVNSLPKAPTYEPKRQNKIA